MATQADLADPLWRLRNLYSCREEGSGRAIPLRLRAEQETLVTHLLTKPNVPVYVIKSRRLGISTAVDTFQSDRAVFTSGFRGMIIDKTQDDATKKMVEIVRFAVDSLPPELLQAFTFDKRNDSELRLRHNQEDESRDSVIYATTGGRGGDCSMLHVSEWGPISALDPKRSQEIRTGAYPAARMGRRVVETTWYGGKSGELWDLVKPVMDGNPNAEGVIFFFPWHSDPQAIRIDGMVTKEIEEYFRTLAEKTSKTFSREQKLWYSAKKLEQGMWVKREYPSTLDEALSVPMAGTIYGDIIDQLREKHRISDFPAEATCPAYSFWDIGLSDFGCVWLVQFVGRDILILDYATACGEPASWFAETVKQWERKHSVVIRKHYLPHDVDTRERSSGKTYKDALIVAGLPRSDLQTVPRTPDIWLGINELRGLLPRAFIHSTNCGATSQYGSVTIPSGLDCLEFYHKREQTKTGGVIYEDPVHDQYSHGADGLRTMAEAYRQGMIEGTSFVARDRRMSGVQVFRGPGPQSYSVQERARRIPVVHR